ncbi:hypothetical protein AB1K18_27850 [Peribacillus simplex]
MVIVTLAVTPGKAGSVAVIVTVPGPSVAVKIGLMTKLPEALVVVEAGAIEPRAGLLTEKFTCVPTGAGLPFTNT